MDIAERIVNKLLSVYPSQEVGEFLNTIQDTCEKVLSEADFQKIVRKTHDDMDKCEGQDGILISGEYFDWKEFGAKKVEMGLAYLRYLTEDELYTVYRAVCGKDLC